MGFFTRTAMDALMKTTHPEINRRQCWNLHPHRKPCTTCKDICPYGEEIFSRPNLVKDWDPCTDCGLCVSACRSGCIAPSPEQVQRDTAAADSDSDTIWIGCEKSARKNTVVRSCICALSWEALAYLALNKKIVLDLTPCGQCENDLCAEQLPEIGDQYKNDLPDEHMEHEHPPRLISPAQICLAQEQAAVPRARGDHAQAQIARQHEKRSQRPQPAVAAIGPQIKLHSICLLRKTARLYESNPHS